MRKKIAQIPAEVSLENKLEDTIRSLQKQSSALESKIENLTAMKNKWLENVNMAKTALVMAQHVTEPMKTLQAQAEQYVTSLEKEIAVENKSLNEISGHLVGLKNALASITYDERAKELATGVNERMQALNGLTSIQSEHDLLAIGSNDSSSVKMDETEVMRLLFTAQATIELMEESKAA